MKSYVQFPCFVGEDGSDGFFVCIPREWKSDLIGCGLDSRTNEAVIGFRTNGFFAFVKEGRGRKLDSAPGGVELTIQWIKPWGHRELLNYLTNGIHVKDKVYLQQMT